MSNIKNYTTQTNSHKGYTIEELRRLFGEGKPRTIENIIKLINECFNYELVSGKGIRITELKNNDFRNNTTKTYKLECTCGEGGSGSGSGFSDVDKGITIDEDGKTVIADLYDYEKGGDIETEGVYAVSLSKDGKLIVDMNQSDIKVKASSLNGIRSFENTVITDNFTFNINLEGSSIIVYKIETWLTEKIGQYNEEDVPNSKMIYDSESDIVQNLNSSKSCTLNRDCSAKVDLQEPDLAIIRKGKIKIYYKIKGVNQDPKIATAQTKFLHKIYYGYTCDYTTERGSEHIAPERKRIRPNEKNQPCFKIYSNNPEDYEDEQQTKRSGLALYNVSGNYKMRIKNTEKNLEYILGYYNMNSTEEGKNTLAYLPNRTSFKLEGLGSHETEPVFIVIMIPKSMVEFTKMDASVDGGTSYSILDTMLKEIALVKDFSYYNNDIQNIELEYVCYTLENSFSVEVNTDIEIDCEISTL